MRGLFGQPETEWHLARSTNNSKMGLREMGFMSVKRIQLIWRHNPLKTTQWRHNPVKTTHWRQLSEDTTHWRQPSEDTTHWRQLSEDTTHWRQLSEDTTHWRHIPFSDLFGRCSKPPGINVDSKYSIFCITALRCWVCLRKNAGN